MNIWPLCREQAPTAQLQSFQRAPYPHTVFRSCQALRHSKWTLWWAATTAAAVQLTRTMPALVFFGSSTPKSQTDHVCMLSWIYRALGSSTRLAIMWVSTQLVVAGSHMHLGVTADRPYTMYSFADAVSPEYAIHNLVTRLLYKTVADIPS